MKFLDEVFCDEVLVVIIVVMQCILNYKYSIYLDFFYKVQFKSFIVDVGVLFLKYMELNFFYYFCVVKVDLSIGGCGSWLVNNVSEMFVFLYYVRDVCYWMDGIVC